MSRLSTAIGIAGISLLPASQALGQEACKIQGNVEEYISNILDQACEGYDTLERDAFGDIIANSRNDMESLLSCYRGEVVSYKALQTCPDNAVATSYLASAPQGYWESLVGTIDFLELQKRMLFPEVIPLDESLMAESSKIGVSTE